MGKYDEVCLEYFLAHQSQLFQEPVAETKEEAIDFLELCMAEICSSLEEVRDYLDESGADVCGMSLTELAQASEVFSLPDGRYLVVEG